MTRANISLVAMALVLASSMPSARLCVCGPGGGATASHGQSRFKGGRPGALRCAVFRTSRAAVPKSARLARGTP